MIARHWRGRPKVDQTENYVRFFLDVTFPKLAKIPGFIRATIQTRPTERGTERGTDFLIVSYWESVDAIRQFAGDDVEAAVIPDAVRAMTIDFDLRAMHYDVIESYEPK